MLHLRLDLRRREVLVAEQIGDIGQADAGHPQVRAEPVPLMPRAA
jgi:hypothetical protein